MAASGGGAFTPPLRSIPTATLLGYLAGGFTKAAGNPVFPKGASGAFDSWGVREFSVLHDQYGLVVAEPDGIWAYYWGRTAVGSSVFKVGLAKSSNNGLTWTRYGSNPVLSPSGVAGHWYEVGIALGASMKEGGTYQLMANGVGSAAGVNVYGVGVLTSTDGLTWTDHGSKISAADFDANAAGGGGAGTLIKRSSGDYLALFELLKPNVTNGWQVYGATAPTFTGTWTPLNGGAPLLSPTGAGWESVGVANPHIIENSPGEYMLIYNGISASTGWQIGVASGSDLTALTRYGSNPVLSKGAAGQWDDQQVETSYLFKEPGSPTLRLMYQGYSNVDGSMQIGLATT